jgi:peptidoglycan-associated lipoprotein
MKTAIACAALLFCAACSPKASYPECKADPDCAPHGQVCLNGFCKQCRDDASCAGNSSGPLCRDAVCVGRPQCKTDGECKEGQRCRQEVCVAECSETQSCGQGKKCVSGRCALDQCRADSDCTGGAACVDEQCKPQSLDSMPWRQLGSCRLGAVYFGFDDATLTPEARQTLSDGWQCLQQNSYRRVLLRGHTDERGTTEYNLALGERRADAVKKYLVGLGAESRRLKALSYGKERPFDAGHDDAAWARNRRVELVPEP